MKRKYLQKIGSLLITVALGLQLVGCTKVTEKEVEVIKDTITEEQETQESSGMGRYVEKVTELSDARASYGNYEIVKRSDGSLLLLSYYGSCYESRDNGSTWEITDVPDFSNLAKKGYIMALGVSPDGTMAVVYDPYSESELALMQGLEVDEAKVQEDDDGIHPKYLLISPDGMQQEFIMELSEEEMYVRSFCFDETGRLFANVFGGNVYEINTQTGKSSLFLTIESSVQYIQIQNQTMLCASYDEVFLYDIEEKAEIEDEILHSFVTENLSLDNTGAGYDGYGFLGEENVIYLACEKGLYRHVLGGSAIEQVIDGNLSTFGNPSYLIMNVVELENEEFLAVFSGARIVHFVYDAEIPTIPNDKLIVYSLWESDSLKKAIMAYQTENPDMYIEYEIGLKESSVTREDAIKKLNTKLMDGSGPDLILLDDLPIDSYVEKSVLMDIKDVVEEVNQTEGLFINLMEPFYENNSLYVVPTEFKLPILAGDTDLLAKAEDYEGIADVMEILRSKNPTGNLVRICSPRGIMKLFSMICEPAWKNEKGTISEEDIKEFLLQSKRIYDAQLKGITQEEIDDYYEDNERNIEWEGVTREDSKYFTLQDHVGYIAERVRIICCEIGDAYGMTDVFSIGRTKGFERTDTRIMNGQSSHVYHPMNLLGVNATGANQEKALAFVRTMLLAKQQEQVDTGFPMNRTALEAMLVGNPDWIDSRGVYSYWASSDENGVKVEGETYWFTEEEKELLRGWIAQASIPYQKDTVLEEAVFSEGAKYLDGQQDIDTTVRNIVQNTAIYMAE